MYYRQFFINFYIVRLNLKFYKIGSGDLTAYPILSELSKRGKPIILSTGLSNLSEINKTIRFIRSQNKVYKNKNIIYFTSTCK